MNRLQPSDFLYRFVSTALGWSVVLQVQWMFRTAPDRSALENMASRLRASPLHRRLVRSPIPFARPSWIMSSEACDVVVDSDLVDVSDASAWMDDELYSVPLDSESGRAWRLRGAHVVDGGFILSLTALHMVTDGKAMMSAALDAVTGSVPRPFGNPVNDGARVTGAPSSNLLADGFDAVRQVANAVAGLGKVCVTSVLGHGNEVGNEVAASTKSPPHERSPDVDYKWATISVDSSLWSSAAQLHGGTPNSLFIAVISGALRRAGYAPLGTPVKVGVPVSQRTEDDERANATAGVSVVLVDEPVAGGDLSGIRSKCKHAFVQLSSGRRPAVVHLQPLILMLPDPVLVKYATAGSGMPDAVTSNLGRYSAELATIGGQNAYRVAFRGIAQNVDPVARYRFGDGLQSWLVEVGDTVTITVVAFDELHFGSSAELGKILSRELESWNVSHLIC
ncbi:diacylglycerol O-acyltransferase [Rhodococcus sp. 27YEA15]|uniref:hypothetical protein n=1 Tax=Rhodococcus sp. 27YEA15 TaxID=3156259 RepID=UPI003C7AFFCC